MACPLRGPFHALRLNHKGLLHRRYPGMGNTLHLFKTLTRPFSPVRTELIIHTHPLKKKSPTRTQKCS